jgi:hypothetical protein
MLELLAPEAPAGAERARACLQVVLDRSASTHGNRLAAACSALIALVDRLFQQGPGGQEARRRRHRARGPPTGVADAQGRGRRPDRRRGRGARDRPGPHGRDPRAGAARRAAKTARMQQARAAPKRGRGM